MTILAMNNFQKNDRDDVALKFTLIEMEKSLKATFECVMPTTPNDNLFNGYDLKQTVDIKTRKENFMNNLSEFIKDAKEAVDEDKNQRSASNKWKEHLGKRFPEGADKDEEPVSASSLSSTIGIAKPYYEREL